MSQLLAVTTPEIYYKGLSPLFAVVGGSVLVLLVGMFRGRVVHRVIAPVLAIASLGTAIGLTIWIWEPGVRTPIISGELSIDTLALGLSLLFYVSGIVTVVLSMRGREASAVGSGDIYCLLLGSIAGMVVLAGAESLIVLFIGIELLSIPLYVLCGMRIQIGRASCRERV